MSAGDQDYRTGMAGYLPVTVRDPLMPTAPMLATAPTPSPTRLKFAALWDKYSFIDDEKKRAEIVYIDGLVDGWFEAVDHYVLPGAADV